MARRSNREYVDPRSTWDTGWAPYTPEQKEQNTGSGISLSQTPEGLFDSPEALNNHYSRQAQQYYDQNVDGWGLSGFDDKVGAAFRQSLAYQWIQDAYEAVEYLGTPKEDFEIDPKHLNGLTFAEQENILSANNYEQAMARVYRLEESRKDLEMMSKGGALSRIGAPLVGGAVDGVFGIPGGAAGAALGARVGRNVFKATKSSKNAILTSRMVGAVAGNLLSGAVPEAIGTLTDPNRDYTDVLAALFFDAAGMVGSARGAMPPGTSKDIVKTIAHKVANLNPKLEDWVLANKAETSAPVKGYSPSEAYQKAQQGTIKVREDADLDGEISPVSRASRYAPEDLSAGNSVRGMEDLSWARPSELRNLGISSARSADGNQRVRIEEGQSVLDLPKGWVHEVTGEVSRGKVDIGADLENYEVQFRSASLDGDGASIVGAVKQAQDLDRMLTARIEDQGRFGIPKEDVLRKTFEKWRPELAGQVAWTTTGKVHHPVDASPAMVELANDLMGKYARDDAIMVLASRQWGDAWKDAAENGFAAPAGQRYMFMAINEDPPRPAHRGVAQAFAEHTPVETLIHEFGHTLTTDMAGKMPHEIRKEWGTAVRKMQEIMHDPKKFRAAAVARFGLGTENYANATQGGNPERTLLGFLAASDNPSDIAKAAKYWASFEEITAQQFVKHIQRMYAKSFYLNGKAKPGQYLPSKALSKWIQGTVGKMLTLWKKSLKDADEVEIATAMDRTFMQMADVNKGRSKEVDANGRVAQFEMLDENLDPNLQRNYEDYWKALQEDFKMMGPADPNYKGKGKAIPSQDGNTTPGTEEFRSTYTISQVGKEYGLGNSYMGTQEETAGVILMDKIIQRAVEEAPPPVQDARRSKIMGRKAGEGGLFDDIISASQIALNSKNPVVRWVAHQLAESPSNLTGERVNDSAAVTRYKNERYILGADYRRIQDAKVQWYKDNGVPFWKTLIDGEAAQKFNDELSHYMARTYLDREIPADTPPSIRKAIEHAAAIHQRANEVELKYGVVGSKEELPDPLGYSQRILDPSKIATLSVEQKGRLIQAIKVQLMDGPGQFSEEVANRVAHRYFDRAEKARGGVFAPQSSVLDSEDAIQTVQLILREEGYSPEQIAELAGPMMARREKHFHRRLALDETADLGDGVTLGSLLWNDHISMLRDRARASAGISALASKGIHGTLGINAVMAAAAKGSGDLMATQNDLRAINQIMHEVASIPVEGVYYNAAIETVVAATAVARLGGLGFTQFAETINVAMHVGGMNVIKGIPEIPRMVADIKKAVKEGKTSTDHPLLGELEAHLGHAFGTDGYFMASPWDTNGRNRDIRGSEQTSKLIRGLNTISHAQSILSGFRAISSTQQRFAAQLSLEYILNNLHLSEPDIKLKDMGINAELFAKLKDLDASGKVIERGADGKATYFHARRMDPELLDELGTVIHRAVNQQIQGTFAGEKGIWQHNSMMRMTLQFRGFPTVALEKQIGRQVGNYGYARAAIMLATSMAMAMPIVIARTYLSSLGRHNQEEYLERQLAWDEVIKKTANYVALSGLAGDLVDVFQDTFGQNTAGGGTTAVGGRIVPAAGLINDAYDAVTNQNWHKALNLAPFATVPLSLIHI